MVYAKKSGFSLAEIMIAILIIGILGGGILYMVPTYLTTARTSRAKSELRALDSAILQFNVHTGMYPQRLKDLVRRPSDERIARRWQKGGYMGKKKDVPLDPWGNKYEYKVTPGQEQKYELFSHGPGGKGSPEVERIYASDD